jgi:RND superfamily putative drug exporter
VHAAVEAAAATSGRSVLVSGLTVMTAMAGMFLTGDKIFASLAIATITVVAMAVLGSLTVLACTPVQARRQGRPTARSVHRPQARNGQGRFWARIVDRVMRRPVLWAALSAGLLIALAIPAVQLRLQTGGPDSFPQSLPAIQTYNHMQAAFPGTALPANVVVEAPDVNSPRGAGGDPGAS